MKATDAPKKFSVVVEEYGIFYGEDRNGKKYEYDYILAQMDNIPRLVNLNQESILYLYKHGFSPTEEGLKALAGRTLKFKHTRYGDQDSYIVVGIVAKKADTKS